MKANKIMMMNKTFKPTYKGMKVNCKSKYGQGLYSAILDRIYAQVLNLQSYYSRITIVRIDLHFPDSFDFGHKLENKFLSQYIKKVKIDLGSSIWNEHKRIVHGWVKEIGTSEKSHYHLFFGFQTLHRNLGAISGDGHTGMWKLFEHHWVRLTGGSVHLIKPHFLKRDDKQIFEASFYHLSYLAKIRDKHFGTGESYRRFGFSKLLPKTKELTVLESLMVA